MGNTTDNTFLFFFKVAVFYLFLLMFIRNRIWNPQISCQIFQRKVPKTIMASPGLPRRHKGKSVLPSWASWILALIIQNGQPKQI